MNHSPIIKCSCIYCACDLATTEGVCYECGRGLHALNEWKNGYKIRMKPKPPLEPDIGPKSTGEMKSETILQMNIANAEMSTRIDVMMDLLMEILEFAIIDAFDRRTCKLCEISEPLSHHFDGIEFPHDKDCPLTKIPKLKGD